MVGPRVTANSTIDLVKPVEIIEKETDIDVRLLSALFSLLEGQIVNVVAMCSRVAKRPEIPSPIDCPFPSKSNFHLFT